MKTKNMLIIAIVAIVVVIGATSVVSAGLFDFLGSNSNLDGQEVNLAAAASLKNVYDEKLIPMFKEKYLLPTLQVGIYNHKLKMVYKQMSLCLRPINRWIN